MYFCYVPHPYRGLSPPHHRRSSCFAQQVDWAQELPLDEESRTLRLQQWCSVLTRSQRGRAVFPDVKTFNVKMPTIWSSLFRCCSLDLPWCRFKRCNVVRNQSDGVVGGTLKDPQRERERGRELHQSRRSAFPKFIFFFISNLTRKFSEYRCRLCQICDAFLNLYIPADRRNN